MYLNDRLAVVGRENDARNHNNSCQESVVVHSVEYQQSNQNVFLVCSPVRLEHEMGKLVPI
jgi:hypothetical protein